MKTHMIGILLVLVLIMGVLVFLQMNKKEDKDYNSNRYNSPNSELIQTLKEIEEVDSNKMNAEKNEYDESSFNFDTENTISLSDNSSSFEGSNISINGNDIYITGAGIYKITGSLSDGRIVVNAPKENVKIVLENASIKCSYSSPIYIYKSASTMIYLEKDSINTLENGEEYLYNDEFSSKDDEEPNACLFSKSDLIIVGEGTLNIKANYNNGITSKDTLYIDNANVKVDAKNHGINGKDNLTIENSKIEVVAKGDAIRSTNDKDDTLGWVRITDSDINITSSEDGIQAETDLMIKDSNLMIVSGGGASSSSKVNNDKFGRDMWGRNSSSSNETSMKGLKASRYLTIDGYSEITIDSADDAIHSNVSLEINDGDITIKAGDDGVHADNTVTVNGGKITILESYEGVEGNNIVINDGDIDIKSSDDGININGGNDKSGFGGFGNMSRPEDVDNMAFSKPSDSDATNKERSFPKSDMKQGKGNGEGRNRRPSGDKMKRPDDFNPDEAQDFFKEGDFPEGMEMPENMPPEINMNDFGKQNENKNSSTESSYKLVINGGKVVIDAKGDGLDSNGSIEMNGGSVVVNGPSESMNSAIDYESSFTLNGGSIIAVGSSGMAQGIKATNGQGTIMTNISSDKSQNAKIEVKDKEGNVLFEVTSTKSFGNVVASSKDIVVGSEYEIYVDGEIKSTVEAKADTSSMGFGGFGGFGGGRR